MFALSLRKFCLLLFVLTVGSLLLVACGDSTQSSPTQSGVTLAPVASTLATGPTGSSPTTSATSNAPSTTVGPASPAINPTQTAGSASVTNQTGFVTATTVPASATTTQLVTYTHPYFSLQLGAQWVFDKDLNVDPNIVTFTADDRKVDIDVLLHSSKGSKNDVYRDDLATFASKKGWKTEPLQAGSLEGTFAVLDEAARTVPPANPNQPYQAVAAQCFIPYPKNDGDYMLRLSTDYRGLQFQTLLDQFKAICQSLRPGERSLEPASATPSPASAPAAGKYPGKLVYDLRFQAAPPQIFTSNPDGTQRSQFAVSAVSPLFSPDGTRLAFVTDRPNPDPNKPDTYISMVVSTKLDGSDRQTLCESEDAFSGLVRWSPRGRYIAVTQRADKYLDVVKLCDTTTKKIVTLPPNKQGQVVQSFDWTPDGNYAVWQVRRADGTSGVYYGDPDKNGADAVLLLDGPKPSEDGSTTFYGGVRISPDGKTVAIGATGKVVFVELPGMSSPLKGKTPSVPVQVSSLAWSPDGRALAFVGCPVEPQDMCEKTLKVIDIASGQIFNPSDKTNIYGVEWSRQ